MPGFLASNSSCLPCDYGNAGCLNCSYDDGSGGVLPYDASLFLCLDCNSTEDYFLAGSLCQQCAISNCDDCLNLTVCDACASGYNFSGVQTCILCNVSGCVFCDLTDPDIC